MAKGSKVKPGVVEPTAVSTQMDETLQITYKRCDELVPYIGNSRKHTDEHIAKIMASIREFGFTKPILIDHQNNIIAGHGTVLGAMRLGYTTIPTTERTNLTDAQRKKYIIADNQIALASEWDKEVLARELKELAAANEDLTPLGFGEEELKELMTYQLESLEPGEGDGDGEKQGYTPTVVRTNEIWDFGNHQIMVASDSLYAVDAMLILWKKLTGKEASHEEVSFSEVERIRGKQ